MRSDIPITARITRRFSTLGKAPLPPKPTTSTKEKRSHAQMKRSVSARRATFSAASDQDPTTKSDYTQSAYAAPRQDRAVSDVSGCSLKNGGRTPVFALHELEVVHVKRAQELRDSDKAQYTRFRNFFKIYEIELACEIDTRKAFSREQVDAWVHYTVGPAVARCLALSDHTKEGLLEVLMVASALGKYGESELVAKDNRGEFKWLRDIQLHTYSKRISFDEQWGHHERPRSGSVATDKAATFVDLAIVTSVNDRLSPEHRVDSSLLRDILNHATSTDLKPSTASQTPYLGFKGLQITRQGSRISETIAEAHKSTPVSTEEHARLVKIAERVQSEWFQDAMLKSNGHYLYDAVREIVSNADAAAWNAWRDKPALGHWHVNSSKKAAEMKSQPHSGSANPDGDTWSKAVLLEKVTVSPILPRVPENKTQEPFGVKTPTKLVRI